MLATNCNGLDKIDCDNIIYILYLFIIYIPTYGMPSVDISNVHILTVTLHTYIFIFNELGLLPVGNFVQLIVCFNA